MNTKHILSILIGVVMGSSITYFAVKPEVVESETIVTSREDEQPSLSEVSIDDSDDPFGDGDGDFSQGEEQPDDFNHGRKAHGYGHMNMKDQFERDLCISFWYMDMFTVVKNFELHTGHRFSKKLGKMYASPVEILEEQLAFMKVYFAESDRMEEARAK